MKKTGILKAMKLCRDYERMGVKEREASQLPPECPGGVGPKEQSLLF